jgi:hypothetical protein
MAKASAAELARQKALEELKKQAEKFEQKGSLDCGKCDGQNCARCNITIGRWAEVKFQE